MSREKKKPELQQDDLKKRSEDTKTRVDEQSSRLPSAVDPIDIVSLENLALKRELAQANVNSLSREIEQLTRDIKTKYCLEDDDVIDQKTFVIIRR